MVAAIEGLLPSGMSSLKRLALLIFFFAVPAITHAVTLDWTSQTWTNNADGTPKPNYYDIDAANAGTDVTITATANNGAVFQKDISTGAPQTPAVASAFQGGFASPVNSLVLAINLANNTQSVTLNLTFSAQYTQGISNLTFTIFDVDFSNVSGSTFEDQLSSIRGLALDGTWVTPTITTSANNKLTGGLVLGIATANDTGANTGAGNVTISFGSTAITQFEFTYGGGSTFANPTFQHVGLYNFSFTPVPEINPAWTAMLSCCAVAALILRHSAKFRK
ncbi:MAG: hypothetical protein QOH88_2476 [Verrucomicrobiota bacterium]|jgi:hypothetical protein